MRYFTMVGYGKEAILIDSNGNNLELFSQYKAKLINNSLVCISSLDTYLGHVARFIEYIYCASLVGLEPTNQNLDFLVSNYENYLLHGQNSSNHFVREIAIKTNRTKSCSCSSLPVIESALIHFLNLSDSIALASGQDGLFSKFLPHTLVPISSNEATKLKCNSVLGSVIRGGPRIRRKQSSLFLSTKRRGTNRRNSPQKESDFEFPLDKIEELLDSTLCYRDKAIYAMLGASGLRTSEVLQLRVEDIDAEEKLVYARSPFERNNPGISQSEFEHLSWKGRQITDTFLIEPWAEYFFDALRDYFRYEYIPRTGHPFIFQTLSGPSRGRPYYLSDRSSRIKQFKKRAKKIGVILPVGDALHSLRHSYGIYLLNYLPTRSGLGVSETIVSHLMGHSDINSTKIYARHDKELIRLELEFANNIIHNRGSVSKKQMLIDYYQSKLQELSLL